MSKPKYEQIVSRKESKDLPVNEYSGRNVLTPSYQFIIFIEISVETMKERTKRIKINGVGVHCVSFSELYIVVRRNKCVTW